MGGLRKGHYLHGGNNPLGRNQHTGRKPIPDYGKSYVGDKVRLFKCDTCGKAAESRRVFPWVLVRGDGSIGETSREYDPTCAEQGCDGTCKVVEGVEAV